MSGEPGTVETNESIVEIKAKVETPNVTDVKKAELPVVQSITDLKDLFHSEDLNNLFLRWTPDIEVDRQPGAVSRDLGSGAEEAGISVYPINPYPERGYGLRQNFRYAGHLQNNPVLAKSGDRKYYLLRGERVLDEKGRPATGNSNEPLLQPESIIPLAEISEDAVTEAYLRTLAFDMVNRRSAIKGRVPKPGEQMTEVVSEMESWPPVTGRGFINDAKLNAQRKQFVESARAEIPTPLEDPKQAA